MNYSTMTDGEINRMVAEAREPGGEPDLSDVLDEPFDGFSEGRGYNVMQIGEQMRCAPRDFCNDPVATMELMTEEGIGLNPDWRYEAGEWVRRGYAALVKLPERSSFRDLVTRVAMNENPYRAVAEAFLMKKAGEGK